MSLHVDEENQHRMINCNNNNHNANCGNTTITISGNNNAAVTGNASSAVVHASAGDSVEQFAEELAQIRQALSEQADHAGLYRAVAELESAARNNDPDSFRKKAVKYMKDLSIPFFAHLASHELLSTVHSLS